MHHFTPVSGLIGGFLIGFSAVLLLWMNGRIAGVSGIFHGVFSFNKNDFIWRLLFLIGLLIGAQIYHIIPGIQFVTRTGYPVSLLIFSGWLVGVGTKLSGGCTSGHGVCGMARFSKRSITATITFMLFGILTVYMLRHIVGGVA